MASIRLGTAINIRLFQTLSAALNNNDSKFTHLIDGEALEDEFGRFRVWSGNLGALQKGHSALDYRLRDSPLLSSNALKLLKELEENITEAISVVTGARLPYEQQPRSEEEEDEDVDDDFYSEDEDEGSETAAAPKTELEQRFREIVDIVDNLYKLSVRIRTPTIRSRSLKASSYQPKDPETGVDVLDQYAAFDLQHTRELVRQERMQHTQEIKDDDPIVMRLSKAITLRRRQFMYWRRHRDKLGVTTALEEGTLAAQPAVERPEAPRRFDTLEAQAGNSIITALKQAASEKTGKTMLSGTEATRHHQSLDEIVDSRSVTSYATTVRDLTGKGIDLPPPPKGADGDKDFECPYCFIICPARYGKGRAWKTHILQDLQPYLCTYPDCESSEQIFRSRREWSDHEASHRKAWRCPEHPNAVYRSKSGLKDHLRHKHPDSFPEAQLDTIINVSETSTVDTREKCPICFVEVDMEGGFSLQNHVANHLERLASFALPRNVNDDKDGASSVASRGRSASSGSQDLSDVSFNSDANQGEEEKLHRDLEKSEASLLFHEHDWDAGDVAAPSGQGLLSAELLGHLPDSSQTSQKRLDFLFPSQDIAEDDFDERMFDDETAEVVDHLADMETFRAYLLSLPGAESVRFLRRFGWWRGYTKFRDQASAREAKDIFDKERFPEVKVTQGIENKAALKFSFPALEKAEKGLLPSTRQATNDDNEDASSASTRSISYLKDTGKLGLIPLLPASEIPTLRALYRTRKLLQRDQSYAPNDAFNQIVSFCFYDITRLKVDAIVNSANRAMKLTKVNDNLNNHIHKQAGPGLQRESKAAGKAKTGQARLTSGCDLPASYVIHAVRPHYMGSKGMEKFNILTECYRSSLKIAMNHGIKTIAFPCLAAGGCGFPSRVAARIALQEVREFLDVYKGYTFERIIFCVYTAIDEKAYKDFLPVFFPPTHGDLENAAPFDPSRDRTSLATQLQEASIQVSAVYENLLDLSEHIPDFISDFPQEVFRELHDIKAAFDSLQALFFGPKETIQNLNGLTVTDIDLICSVMQSFSGGVLEFTEQGKAGIATQQPIMWNDFKFHNFHIKSSNGRDLLSLLEICLNFVQSLDDILSHDGIEPYEMATMRVRLGSYRLKITGEGHKGVQDHFDEVMYTREFQRSATPSNRVDIIKLHQIPSIARLYQLGDIEYKPTYAIASANFNHTVYLLRDDITRVESDVIVNSTDPHFLSMGTLDRTLFKKGGPAMQQACSDFGLCNEGDVRVTPGFLLPAKHVIHAIPPQTYRSNTKDILRKIYREILYQAQSLKATSIAIPTIGTGSLNYPRRDCASLALEEVKHFLESAEPTSSIERIIFCVFGSSDEFIYKSLLPVYFPPIDLNLNKALPTSVDIPSSTLDPKAAHHPDEPNTPSKRSLFGSLGEAFRNVRFGKQPVTERSRGLNSAEQHALTNFEDHCHTCSTCNNIAKLYAEGKTLCPDGYAMAQLILQYLYMEQDRSVYSAILKEGKREKVEVPERYRHSWNLLVTVEMSHRDGEKGRSFVNIDQPYLKAVEGEELREKTPLGLTEHNAEVTIPVKEEPHMESGTEPKTFTAMIFELSSVTLKWRPFSSDECIICVSSGKIEIFETEQQLRAKSPLWNLNFATARISEDSDTEVAIDPMDDIGHSLLIRSVDTTNHDLLFQALKRAVEEYRLVHPPRIEQAVFAPDLLEPEKFPFEGEPEKLPLKEEPKRFEAQTLHHPLDKDTWVPFSSGQSIVHVYPSRVDVYETEEQTKTGLPRWTSNLTSAWVGQTSDTALIVDSKGWMGSILFRSQIPAKHDLLLQALTQAQSKLQGTASSTPDPDKFTDLDQAGTEHHAFSSTKPELEIFKAFLLRWSGVTEGWVPLHPEESFIHIFPGRAKAEIYATDDKMQPPLMYLDLTSLWFNKDSDLNIKIDRRGWKEPIMLRSQNSAARDVLLSKMRLERRKKGEIAEATSSDVEAPLKPDYEKAMAFIFTWSDGEETWQPIRPDECSIHIHLGKAEVYANDQRSGVRLPLLYLDLTPTTVLKISYSDLVIDKAWKEKIMLRCSGPTECEMLYRSLNMARKDSSKYLQTSTVQGSTREHPEDARAFLLRWSKVDQTWFSVGAKELDVYILPTKIELYDIGLEGQARTPTLSLDLTDQGVVESSEADLVFNDQDEDKKWMLRCRSPEVCSMLVEKIKHSFLERSKVPQLGSLTPQIPEQETDDEATAPPRPDPLDSFIVTWILAWSEEHLRWENVYQSGECVVNFYADNKTEIYRASRQKNSRVPLLYLNLTPEVTVHKVEDSSTNSVSYVGKVLGLNLDLRIEKACKRDLLVRCRSEEEREMLFKRLEQARLVDYQSMPFAAHKLQQEIDKCFKKVAEGVATFEVIHDKIQQTSNPLQKEKLEDSLKKEIKKLQRSRDQIKIWAAMSEIKDKKPLQDQRKLIETQMEKYKAAEKKMKTKAYSKEGLHPALNLDPKDKERMEMVNFLVQMNEDLEQQVESLQADNLGAKRVLGLEETAERHKWHQGKLDLLQRALENGNVKVDEVKDLEDSIRYYVENNGDPDFMEDDTIYDDVNLQEEEAIFGIRADADHVSTQADESLDSVLGLISVGPNHITTFKVPKIQKWSEERQSWENLHQQNECTIYFYPKKAEVYATNHATQASVLLLYLNLTPSVLVVNLPGTNTNLTIEKAYKKKLKVACESKEQRKWLYNTLRQVMSGEQPNTEGSDTQDTSSTSRTPAPSDDPLYRETPEDTSSAGPSDQKEPFSKSETPVPFDNPIHNPLDLPSASTLNSPTTAPTPRPVSALTQQIEAMRISNRTSPDSYSMLNLLAKRVLAYLKITSARSDVREDRIAEDLGAERENVARALEDLQIMGLAFTTVDDHTWCALYDGNEPALQEQRPQGGNVPQIHVGDADEEERAMAESIEMALRENWRVTGQPSVVGQNPKPHEVREDQINIPQEPTAHAEAAEASVDMPPPPEKQQRQGSTTPTPFPIDLSTSSLASLNIDEFFTYLDLAISITSTIASPSSPSRPRSPLPTLIRSMSLPLDDMAGTDPTLPYYADTPSHPISSIQEDDTTQDNPPDQITHPRPTTPDRTQPAPIPPGARWTKIDRRLVNAQALEDAREKFEVREDCMVVFRVLSREDVLILAERTRRIRLERAEEGDRRDEARMGGGGGARTTDVERSGEI